MQREINTKIPHQAKTYSPAKTVQKALRVLEFIGERQPVRPAEIGKQLKLTRANVHRLLSTLEDMEYIEKLNNGCYQLTFKLFKLGNTVPQSRSLVDAAKSYMTRLSELSGENVNLAVRYGDKIIYIDKVESKNYIKLDQPVGMTDPIYCTALGKVLLSDLPEKELKKFLSSLELTPYTRHTTTRIDKLVEMVSSVRDNGYATDLKELSEDIHCMAAPICDHTNSIIAAISISGPAVRLTKKRMMELKDHLMEAAGTISSNLGCSMKWCASV